MIRASNSAAGNVHPKTDRELLRHSSIGLTMDVYGHTLHGGLASALDGLPDLSHWEQPPQRATGTLDATADRDSVLASCLARSGTEPSRTTQRGAVSGGILAPSPVDRKQRTDPRKAANSSEKTPVAIMVVS
jgi:hypothetical protein